LAFLSLFVLACGSHRGEVVFPAAYVASRDLSPAPPTCSAPVQIQVTDARQTPSVVGRRFEEDKPTVEYPVKMEGDPAAYVKSGLEKSLRVGGGAASAKTPVTLAVTITQMSMEEKIVHLADFASQLSLEATLTSPTSSQTCWSGRVSGTGKNHGKGGNPTNYQETFSRALDDASDQLIKAPGFADALCGKCSS